MRNILTPANWTRLGALVLALLIWVNVAFRSTYKYTLTVPVRVTGIPENLVPVEPVTVSVEIEAEATGRDLFVLMYSKPVFEIKGRALRPGRNSVPLRMVDLDIPKSVELMQSEIIDPKTVEIRLDRLVVKSVPVVDNVTLMPKEGWVSVGKPVTTPGSVDISGPAALVKAIGNVQTDTLRLEGVTGAVKREVALRTGHPNVSCTPPVLVYTASVQRLSERRIRNIPVKVLRVPRNIEAVLDEPEIALTVIGGEDIVSGLSRDDLEVTLDYRKLEASPGKKFAASIKVPEHVRWVKAEPQRFGLKEKIIIRQNRKR